jgi:hypothetical protein
VCHYANGDKYEGNSFPSLLVWSIYNNTRYYNAIGQFEIGQWHGSGRLMFATNDKYDGPFKNGQMTGTNGRYEFMNGDVFEGDFLNGKFHGKGTYRFGQTNLTCTGSFEDNMLHGPGTCTRVLPNIVVLSWQLF